MQSHHGPGFPGSRWIRSGKDHGLVAILVASPLRGWGMGPLPGRNRTSRTQFPRFAAKAISQVVCKNHNAGEKRSPK